MMSIATMTDRTLPLAERVRAAVYLALRMYPDLADEYDIALTALLADIAAADRLARAMRDYHDTLDAGRIGDMAAGGELVKMADAMFAALDAYRARMAQGAGDA